MKILGKLLRKMTQKTQRPDEDTSPFIFEYFEYASKSLEQLSLFGPIFFKGCHESALDITKKFKHYKIIPSFVHGDFVFRNIHVHDEKVGLIDFANAIFLSHPLNDIYNMRIALGNMFLSHTFEQELLAAFYQGFGTMEFPDIAHEFYHEYHRRRWLMLKLSSSRLKDLLQGLRGLATFARPGSGGAHSL